MSNQHINFLGNIWKIFKDIVQNVVVKCLVAEIIKLVVIILKFIEIDDRNTNRIVFFYNPKFVNYDLEKFSVKLIWGHIENIKNINIKF
ncbi:hypothetical protein BpHYR1_016001 [Brachionus plicatilis]|uniref:Uncharacterized protein n=1 Tax=Brachionus plicatilis TaxID=10195 RepID=A0A3M7RAV7_BRAPC|nr:hypothetical protein BpHYR1_016001 [Brachionus plicatilis]